MEFQLMTDEFETMEDYLKWVEEIGQIFESKHLNYSGEIPTNIDNDLQYFLNLGLSFKEANKLMKGKMK